NPPIASGEKASALSCDLLKSRRAFQQRRRRNNGGPAKVRPWRFLCCSGGACRAPHGASSAAPPSLRKGGAKTPSQLAEASSGAPARSNPQQHTNTTPS